MKCKRTRNHLYKFYLSEKESDIIEKKIEISGLSKSAYFRKMALDGFIIKQDLKRFDEVAYLLTKLENDLQVKSTNEIEKKLNEIWQCLRKI